MKLKSIILIVLLLQLLFGASEKILFSSNKSGNYDIYIMNPDGSNEDILVSTSNEELFPALSNKGKLLAYRSGNGSEYSLKILDLETYTTSTIFTHSRMFSPLSFLNNDSLIVYSDDINSEEVLTVNIYDTTITNLTNNSDSSDFSPVAGENLIVYAQDSDGMYCALCVELMSMNLDGSNKTRLTNNSGKDKPTHIFNDSLIVYYYQGTLNDADRELRLYDLSDDSIVNLGSGDFGYISPDGEEMLFIYNDEIYKMDIDGSNRTQITNFGADVHTVAWVEYELPEIQLALTNTTCMQTDLVSIPVNVNFPENSLFSSAEIHIKEYQEAFEFIEIDTVGTMVGSAGWNLVENDQDSLLIIVSGGSEDIMGEGTLFNLIFRATGEPNNTYSVVIDTAIFNNGENPVEMSHASIEILPKPVYGDVNQDGQVLAYDGSLILKYLVGMETLDYQAKINANVTLDSSISALDASVIYQYRAQLIDELPVDTNVIDLRGTASFILGDAIRYDDIISIPIMIDNGNNLLSMEGIFTFDQSEVSFNQIIWNSTLDNFTIELSEDNGTVKFAGAGSLPDGENGIFAIISIKIKDGIQDLNSIFEFKEMRTNENEIKLNLGSVELSSVTSIEDSQIPENFVLTQNYPNPFNPKTTIEYGIPEKSDVELAIVNLMGRKIKQWSTPNQQPGWHKVIWDGVDMNGNSVSTGIYIYSIKAGNFVDTKKMVFMK